MMQQGDRNECREERSLTIRFKENSVEVKNAAGLNFNDIDSWVRQRFDLPAGIQLAYYAKYPSWSGDIAAGIGRY